MTHVAIIGAGPGGLAAARWLKSRGFQPEIFESHSDIGGQWNHTNPNSGVWPQMRTNTYLCTTHFSDLDYPEGTAIFPRNQEVLQHLRDFSCAFDLTETLHTGMTLTRLERTGTGYQLTFDSPDGPRQIEASHVVVATGRYNHPTIPDVPGLDSFSGRLGVTHAFRYKDPERYRGARVIVAGGAISALEVASDLAMLGAASVHLAQRRQRYVMPKMVRGVPFEYYGFTYASANTSPPADETEARAALREFALCYGGDPARYGAPAPDRDALKAGFTGSQHYLNLVAEDRLRPVPWIESVDGQTVTFADGSTTQADAILFGTGFDLSLPFLSDELAGILEVDRKGLTLSDFTLHPDLPGLAFVGLFAQNGGYIPVIEAQARYLAYCWGGEVECSDERLRDGLEACRAEKHHADYQNQHQMALRFARLSGTDPAGQVDDDLFARVEKSATTTVMYRLAGPDALADARARFERSFDRYGPNT
jgi:hypothetical protein